MDVTDAALAMRSVSLVKAASTVSGVIDAVGQPLLARVLTSGEASTSKWGKRSHSAAGGHAA